MTYNYAKSTPMVITSSFVMFLIFSGISNAFADNENDFVSVNAESIKNDPMLAKILENIEKSRQQFSDIQQKSTQERIIDEQRAVAKDILEQELAQMFKDNEDFTSLAAFNKFLKTVSNDNTKNVFQGLFDYQQNKIDSARTIMADVMRNGGSLQDARDAYHEALKIPRSDMIRLVTDLNIQAGFSNSEIQDHFDDNGKLPRYDDEQESIVSFVDLTTSAQNVNSSPVDTTEDTTTEDTTTDTTEDTTTDTTEDTTTDTTEDTTTDTTENTLIQKLLDEIRILKNKIAELEKIQNPNLQQAVFSQQNTDSTVFANWVSDYIPGKGPYEYHMNALKKIPVNALNEPNSYNDSLNSLSLGRGGQVTLGFSESVMDKLIVYETTNEEIIRERSVVEVSMNGEDWVTLSETQYGHDDTNVHEYVYDLTDVGCITHVRITDNTGYQKEDGFDIDALGATQTCTNHT